MERLNPPLTDKEAFIKTQFAEKKGRPTFGDNPYTCYISINTPEPNLPYLTASLLIELSKDKSAARTWTERWDKSIMCIAPNNVVGCTLMRGDDLEGKKYLPVSTSKVIDTDKLVAQMPEGNGMTLAINEKPMTTDAFLISYFHMVNEAIWTEALKIQGDENVRLASYSQALDQIMTDGFSVKLMSDEEIILAKLSNEDTDVRIYGSHRNEYVPQIMGAVLRDK